MIPFFMGYALVVWCLAMRDRRTFRAWLWVSLGVVGLLLVNWGHSKLGDYSKKLDPDGEGISLISMKSLMYPYTVLVGVVAAYIAVLPRRSGVGCWRCGYDLDGLPEEADVCPECGEALGRSHYRPSGERRESLRAGDGPREQTVHSAEREAVEHA